MESKKLILTEDIIKLISALKFRYWNEGVIGGINTYDMYGGSHLFEDIAAVLGYWDKAIPNTENQPMGRSYPPNLEKYFLDLDSYIASNIVDLENLLHQQAFVGLEVGVYEFDFLTQLWKYVKEEKKLVRKKKIVKTFDDAFENDKDA